MIWGSIPSGAGFLVTVYGSTGLARADATAVAVQEGLSRTVAVAVLTAGWNKSSDSQLIVQSCLPP